MAHLLLCIVLTYREMEEEKQRRGISRPEFVLDMWSAYKSPR
ncbi:hypothetical protein [Thermococcus sp. 18S1]|nr:hypothetical protein [Thermococcus sp. 18S1]